MKVLGSGDIAPRILHFGTRWKWVVSFTSRPLYPQEKSPWCPLDRRLGGSQSRYGRGDSQPPPGLELTIIQPVAQRYTTEQSRLHIFPIYISVFQVVSSRLNVCPENAWARSGPYGECSNEVPPIQFFRAEETIQFRSRPMRFLAFLTMKGELRGKKFRSDQLSAARFREVVGAL
jgi:hypothetical protein